MSRRINIDLFPFVAEAAEHFASRARRDVSEAEFTRIVARKVTAAHDADTASRIRYDDIFQVLRFNSYDSHQEAIDSIGEDAE
jgi:hypothetical protein